MRKILIILGLVLCSILMQGIVFFLSSRMPAEAEVSELEEPSSDSTLEDMLASAANYRDQRRYDVAGEFVRLAIDLAVTSDERSLAGFQMGGILFDDYLQGGDSRAEAAASYLQAAFDDSTPASLFQVEIGLVLLDVLEEMDDTEQMMEYLEKMILTARDPEGIVKLWKRKFDFLMDSEGGWHEMNKALATAESLPLQSEEWAELITDMRLRSREILLADENWVDPYKSDGGGKEEADYRMKVFAEIRSKLERIIETGEREKQEEAMLRLANVMVSVGNYEDAQKHLEQFIEREPTHNLTEALMLLSRISRVQGEVSYAAELAESLIRRFDYNAHTQAEILHVVKLLEEHNLNEDALELWKGALVWWKRRAKHLRS